MRKFHVGGPIQSFAILILLGVGAVASCSKRQEPEPAAKAPVLEATLPTPERGSYLVTIMACGDCHTPFKMGANGPEPDLDRLLSGHPETLKMPPPPKLEPGPWMWVGAGTNTAFAGPWGVTYSANLTPDTNTGLGIWTEEMFLTAFRTAKHMGTSRKIQPPMPIQQYGMATDEDLKSIFAYLKSVPPIVNHVPEYEPPAEAGH